MDRKLSTELKPWVWNRVKIIQDSGVKVLFSSSSENIADILTKSKPNQTYVNIKIWDEGPTYLQKRNEAWMPGRRIQELKITQTLHEGDKEEIEREMKNRKMVAILNHAQLTEDLTRNNFISKCMEKSNNLTWVCRMV